MYIQEISNTRSIYLYDTQCKIKFLGEMLSLKMTKEYILIFKKKQKFVQKAKLIKKSRMQFYLFKNNVSRTKVKRGEGFKALFRA